MDVEAAIEELVQSSLVERTEGEDASPILYVPVMALVFGRRKLETTPQKAAIDADLELLRLVGATAKSALPHGTSSQIERFFRGVANQVKSRTRTVEEVRPSLEYICRRISPAWMMLARLCEDCFGSAGLTHGAECVRRFLESGPPADEAAKAWSELARIYERQGEWGGAAQAQVRICTFSGTGFRVLSETANWLNSLLYRNTLAIDSEEKRVVYTELAHLMESRVSEADPTDLSRLAWLFLHLGDEKKPLITLGAA
ncbi:MAG: hypothetical protein M0002_06380 [Rhodospirillales bacterium]|nr:hypothetical protein [Rhodospirillales bacterium]